MASTSRTSQADLKSDFKKFLCVIWKLLALPPPTPAQLSIADYLQHGPRRRMVKAFRGIGKSWITAAFVLWCLWRDPNERILVVSASKDRADAFAVFTRRLIDVVPMLRHLAPGEGQRDSTLLFDVGPSDPHQAPSVKSAGITGQITGSRATKIIADDIETPKNSLTVTMRDRLSEQVKEFDAIILPGGQIIYLGTDQTEASLYKKLPERGYQVRVWPAEIPSRKKQSDGKPSKFELYGEELSPFIRKLAESLKDGDPTDPRRFDEADLRERKASYGRGGYALQYMLDPAMSDEERYPLKLRDFMVMNVDPDVAPSRVIFGSRREDILHETECVGLTGDKWVAPAGVVRPYITYQGSVMYIDPAGRGKDRVGYAIVKFAAGKMFVPAAGGLKGGYEDATLLKLAQLAKGQGVQHILIEPNFGDGMWHKLFTPFLKKVDYNCHCELTEWQQSQKEARIIDILEPALSRHLLIVDPAVLEQDLQQPQDHQLFYQLTRITREKGSLRHDDALDALAGAVHHWHEQLGQGEREAAEAAREAEREDWFESWSERIHGAPSSSGSWNSAR